MNTYWTEPVILSREQFRQLSDSLCRPDKEYMDRRNALFAQMDEQINMKQNGRDMEVEISGLDLSFIDEMDEQTETHIKVAYKIGDRRGSNIRMKTVGSGMVYGSGGVNWREIKFVMRNQHGVNHMEQYVTEKDTKSVRITGETGQIVYAA